MWLEKIIADELGFSNVYEVYQNRATLASRRHTMLAAYIYKHYWGFTSADIAERLHLDMSKVSLVLREAKKALNEEDEMRDLLNRIIERDNE